MRQLESRKYFIGGFFIFFSLIYLVRLFYIQLMTEEYYDRSISVAVEKMVEYPMRGNIYDRYGKPLVQNEIAYDIMYTPYKSKIDTLKFCALIGIDKKEFIKRAEKAKNYSYRKASVFESLIKGDDFGGIREKLYQFKGMSYKPRTVRKYPAACSASILGYLARVTKKDTKKDEFYDEEDYKGSSGIERSYEKVLRGKKGYKYHLRDINGNHFASYLDGELDEIPQAGKDLQISISTALQIYGEQLMEGKRGAIIAIDPSTGEILAMVSAPTYDPNYW
jgi:penicillin-binding protein 2